jgi:hypothetical protein
MMQRLKSNEQDGCVNLVRSLSAIMTARSICDNLLLMYEDRFFESIDTLKQIAGFLGLHLSESEAEEIYSRFTKARVTEFVQKMKSLPPDRGFMDAAGWYSDRETQFNERHIGDARSGKWKEIVGTVYQGVVDRTFEGAIGKSDLCEPFFLRFPECLFSPTAYCGPGDHDPHRSGENIQLLRLCWLPRGRWRLTVAGGLPSCGDTVLRCGHDGKWIFEQPLSGAEIEEFSVSFEYDLRVYDSPLNVSCEANGLEKINPFRHNAIELSANFVSSIP